MDFGTFIFAFTQRIYLTPVQGDYTFANGQAQAGTPAFEIRFGSRMLVDLTKLMKFVKY